MSPIPPLARRSDAEYVARAFHETYEELAPLHGYKTRDASAVPWEDVPEQNKALMINVAHHLLDGGVISRAFSQSDTRWPALGSAEDADRTHQWARETMLMWEAERKALEAEIARLRKAREGTARNYSQLVDWLQRNHPDVLEAWSA